MVEGIKTKKANTLHISFIKNNISPPSWWKKVEKVEKSGVLNFY